MRQESAVSEILGAVFLIGIVIVSIAIIGTSLLSQSPAQGSNFPKATTGMYCVECEGTYEIVIKHDGGEAFPTDETDLKVLTKKGQVEPDSIEVFSEEAPECSAKVSRGGTKYSWESIENFGPGMIAKVVVNKGVDDTEDDVPTGLTIEYQGQPGAEGVGTQYFERIKNETTPVYNPETGAEIETMQELIQGKFEPKLESVSKPDKDGYCSAVFYYDNSLDLVLQVNPCTGEAMIIDENGNTISGTTCAQPWNEFVGVGTGGDYLKKDMGQPKEFLKTEESSKSARSFTIKFKNGIQWRLANTVSDTAYCEAGVCDCASQETCLWGYMFFDTNENGQRDVGEPGFSSGSVDIYWRYKNGERTDQTSNKVPSATGMWKSDCIQMSGWAFDIVANLPSDFQTSNEYLNYDEKMTGQDKKNPPQLDFAITTATPTPEPVGNPVAIDNEGIGAQLYTADNTTDVIVKYIFSDAGYINTFSLSEPINYPLGITKYSNGSLRTPFGTTWTIGKFANGTELIFADNANGKTYYSGPASRNPDQMVHGAVSFIEGTGTSNKYLVSFEDYWQGGDKDYNDVQFYVTGNIYSVIAPASTPAPTVTPASDTTKPSISGVSATKSYDSKKVTITWTASDNVGVSGVIIRLSTDGGHSYPSIVRDSSWVTNANEVKTGSFTWDPNKNYNIAKFKVIVSDAAGNTNSAESGTIYNLKK